MQGREFAGGKGYRYGFGTQETDDEVSGRGNSYTAEFWQYDCRLGRRWNVDPMPDYWESVYGVLLSNPIRFTDFYGNTEDERKQAVLKAKEYVDKNPGNSYQSPGMGNPGEGVDCSGMVRKCVMASGLNDPTKGSTGDGQWNNGVALIANSPMVRQSSISLARIGDIVTLDTDRGKGENGKYDHIGIITSITTNDNGEIIGFNFIHSGGNPKSGKSGPKENAVKVNGSSYWDKRVRNIYQWDSPDEKVQVKARCSENVLPQPVTSPVIQLPIEKLPTMVFPVQKQFYFRQSN